MRSGLDIKHSFINVKRKVEWRGGEEEIRK
jgi:hypothetical protein